jgi:hypothetical protein
MSSMHDDTNVALNGGAGLSLSVMKILQIEQRYWFIKNKVSYKLEFKNRIVSFKGLYILSQNGYNGSKAPSQVKRQTGNWVGKKQKFNAGVDLISGRVELSLDYFLWRF